jgi:hypothetical protein
VCTGLTVSLESLLSVTFPATSMATQIEAGDARVCPRCLANERKNRLPMAHPIQYTRTSTPTSTPQRTENGREPVREDIFQAADEGIDNPMAGETYTTLPSPVTTKRSTISLSRLVDASCKRWVFWYSEDECEFEDLLSGCGVVVDLPWSLDKE